LAPFCWLFPDLKLCDVDLLRDEIESLSILESLFSPVPRRVVVHGGAHCARKMSGGSSE
jgi:hypothetical protein